LAFESPCLLCQTIPFCPSAGCWTKCWAEGFFHSKNWIYTINTFYLLENIHFLALESPAWQKMAAQFFECPYWAKVLGRMK
jgi:hypothetical protein